MYQFIGPTSYKMSYQDENNQKLTELRFIHNCVITFIQWMGRWWVLVHCGLLELVIFHMSFSNHASLRVS
jgi:hypothetical protein